MKIKYKTKKFQEGGSVNAPSDFEVVKNFLLYGSSNYYPDAKTFRGAYARAVNDGVSNFYYNGKLYKTGDTKLDRIRSKEQIKHEDLAEKGLITPDYSDSPTFNDAYYRGYRSAARQPENPNFNYKGNRYSVNITSAFKKEQAADYAKQSTPKSIPTSKKQITNIEKRPVSSISSDVRAPKGPFTLKGDNRYEYNLKDGKYLTRQKGKGSWINITSNKAAVNNINQAIVNKAIGVSDTRASISEGNKVRDKTPSIYNRLESKSPKKKKIKIEKRNNTNNK